MIASYTIELEMISETWLKFSVLKSPSLRSEPASSASRSEGGVGPSGGPGATFSSSVRTMKLPSEVFWTRASPWPSSLERVLHLVLRDTRRSRSPA